jgi:hypothetical protein
MNSERWNSVDGLAHDRADDPLIGQIDTFYDRQATGNLERQQQTMESWARTYPRDPVPLGLLAGLATQSTGQRRF